jgi:hypothetical protein
MMATENADGTGRTRFARAVSEIMDLADETIGDGDLFTVILAGNTADFLKIGIGNVNRLGDEEEHLAQIKQALSLTTCTYGNADINGAIDMAEEVMYMNKNTEVILYTGDVYSQSKNVTVRTIGGSEWNAAVLDFQSDNSVGNLYKFTASVGNFGSQSRSAPETAVSIKFEVRGYRSIKDPITGEIESVLGTYTNNVTAQFKSGEKKDIIWTQDDSRITSYTSVSVTLEVEDSFYYDDFMILYGGNPAQATLQIVTLSADAEAASIFWEALYRNMPAYQTSLVALTPATLGTTEYKTSGFDFYIFDNYTPSVLPEDGSVIFTGLPSDAEVGRLLNLTVNDTDVSLGNNPATGENYSFEVPGSIGDNDPLITNAIKFALNVAPPPITQYTKVAMPNLSTYRELLTCNGDPVLLVRDDAEIYNPSPPSPGYDKTVKGAKTFVLTVPFSHSHTSVHPIFPLFISAALKYAMPPMIDNHMFTVGQSVSIGSRIGTNYIETKYSGVPLKYDEVFDPDNLANPVTWKAEIGNYDTMSANFSIPLPGSYRVEQHKVAALADTQTTMQARDFFFARLMPQLSDIYEKQQGLSIIRPDSDDSLIANKWLDVYCWVALVMLAIMIIEWWVQYREQF